MMVINLAESHPILEAVIRVGDDEIVVLRPSNGSAFAVSQLGDFEVEVELLKNNPDFLSILRQHSCEDTAISLQNLRSQLAL
jgi:hypothetical protein